MFRTLRKNGTIFIIMAIINCLLFFLTGSLLYAAWATQEISLMIGVILSFLATLIFTHQNFKNNENNNG